MKGDIGTRTDMILLPTHSNLGDLFMTRTMTDLLDDLAAAVGGYTRISSFNRSAIGAWLLPNGECQTAHHHVILAIVDDDHAAAFEQWIKRACHILGQQSIARFTDWLRATFVSAT